MKKLDEVRVGDVVYRYLAGVAEMEMRVTTVSEDRIECTAVDAPVDTWTFDRKTGAEIDEDLGWGPQYGVTGSYILAERGKPGPDGGFSPAEPGN
jgi:hypothetical protein